MRGRNAGFTCCLTHSFPFDRPSMVHAILRRLLPPRQFLVKHHGKRACGNLSRCAWRINDSLLAKYPLKEFTFPPIADWSSVDKMPPEQSLAPLRQLATWCNSQPEMSGLRNEMYEMPQG